MIAAGAMAAILESCVVGPDFRVPESPAAAKSIYTSGNPLSRETVSVGGAGGEQQTFVVGKNVPAAWWIRFRSSDLDRLIAEALRDSPTLAAAEARLRQSRENVNALVGGSLYPSVDAGASVSRQKISGASFGQPDTVFSPFTLYNASVKVSYSLDLFGGARRELEALQSQVEYERFQQEGAYAVIAANIVTAAIADAAFRAQVRATREIISAEERQLAVVERQAELGAVSKGEVLAQRAQVAQARAALPQVEKALEQNRHLLAVLSGRSPSESAALPVFELEQFELPRELPVSLPSTLVRQRPDIRASEALLHAASAGIGVAAAGLYPQISLTGNYGSDAIRSGGLFSSGSSVWSLGAGITQPLFHGGELKARKRAAIAAYDEAAANYRTTVLVAFQNVADVLRALEADAATLKAQTEADDAASESLDLARKQFELGAINYLLLLNAQRQYQQAHIGLVQAREVRFADTAALFQALGGGWESGPEASGAGSQK